MQDTSAPALALTDSQEYLLEGFEPSAQAAKDAGCTVIMSTPYTLLLDMDNGAALDRYALMRRYLLRQYPGVVEEQRWVSKSGKGTHIVMRMEHPLEVPGRLLLQSFLGSDPVRDMLGLSMFRMGIENPIMLFKPGVK